MKKLLICVDCQYDFIEGGKLPVPGGRKAVKRLAKLLREHGEDYAAVVCTLDWHPHGHCSFVPNGGTWPEHCVQHSHGAAMFDEVMDTLPHDKTHMFVKGCDTDRDEYSFLDSDKNRRRFATLLRRVKPDVIEVCGIAGDVCVMNTARGLIEMGLGDKIALINPAIASLDSAVTTVFVGQNGLKWIK